MADPMSFGARFGIVAVSLLLIAACGGLEEAHRFDLKTMFLSAAQGANGNQPVAVDLVVVHDEGMIGALSGLSAADWFERKAQFRLDFEDGFKVFGWEMVPENSLPPISFSEEDLSGADGRAARAGFLFARYASPGQHRARLESRSGLKVLLGPETFTLADQNSNN